MRLASGSLTAIVSADGGRLIDLREEQTPLIVGRGAPGTFGSALLAPWPNLALEEGRWTWRDRALRLPGDGLHPLHGLVHSSRFELEATAEDTVQCRLTLVASQGYPFTLDITAEYRLHGSSLEARLTATNRCHEAAPVGLGVHPYLLAPQAVDELELRLRAAAAFQVGATQLEAVLVPECADGERRRIGSTLLDHALRPHERDADGRVTVDVRTSTHELRVWGGPTCRWFMLYTADESPGDERRRGLGVEPMTCPPDALRSGTADVVEPGQTLELAWGIDVRRRADQAATR